MTDPVVSSKPLSSSSQSLLTDFGFTASCTIVTASPASDVVSSTSISLVTVAASSNITPLATGVVSGVTASQVVDADSPNWDASSASTDHVSDTMDSWSDSDEDADSVTSDYVSNPPGPATSSGAAGSSATAGATPPHAPHQATRIRIRGLMGVSSVEHVKYAYCSNSDAADESDTADISSILSGHKYGPLIFPEVILSSTTTGQALPFPLEVIDRIIYYACTRKLEPASQLALYHQIIIRYARPVQLWLDILAMNPELPVAVRRVDIWNMDKYIATLPSIMPIISNGYALIELSIRSVHFLSQSAQDMSQLISQFNDFRMVGCSYDDDAMLYLLDGATHLGSLSIGISEPCVLIKLVPDPSLASSNLSIATHPILNSSPSTTMHTFSYVAEYGTNYLLESPRFMTVVLARTSQLTSLYIRIDHHSLDTIQELVNGTAHTLENIDVLLNNSLTVLCKSLASCPRDTPVKYIGLSIQTSPLLQSNAVWCDLANMFRSDIYFLMAERLDVDIYAQTARDAAEPGVKDIVNLVRSHLATARSNLMAKVYRKLALASDCSMSTAIIPFQRTFLTDVMRLIAYQACISPIEANILLLVNKYFHDEARRFLFRRVSVRIGRAAGVSLEGYQKYSYLCALARSFELDAIAVSDVHLLSELLQLFDSSFNLLTLVVLNVDFHTSICLSIFSMAHRFLYLVLNGCKIDGLHVAALLNSMPSVKTVSFGDAAVSYYRTPYVADLEDVIRLATSPVDYSPVTSFIYNCDARFDHTSFGLRRPGDTLQQYHPLIDDVSFLHALLPRLAAAQHISLFICYYSRESALRVLASCGTTLLSLSLVFAYDHHSDEPADVTLPMCQSLTNLRLTLHLEDLTTLLSSIPAQTKLTNLHVTIHITNDRFDAVSWYNFQYSVDSVLAVYHTLQIDVRTMADEHIIAAGRAHVVNEVMRTFREFTGRMALHVYGLVNGRSRVCAQFTTY
ncbi:hypothetical protein ARMGADRAFT_1084928 [Armillaria gallica]|uniref:Uncharacterized protein n=1 Tax=Armillaria gallica TaxID=47427 RepID=A0A2H3D1I3_ARMGA|nr:hypothetical protein ARMGADRAFT_1084928 [Armillaria gallica]